MSGDDAGMAEKWGAGSGASSKPFETGALQDGTPYELVWGEHPHSRDDNRMYARFKDGRIADFDGHRVQEKIEFETFNYAKESGLSGSEVRRGGQARIRFDGQLVYSFFFRDPDFALLEGRRILAVLREFPVDWRRTGHPGELVGRRIFYREVPAVITDWLPEEGAVMIDADGHRLFPEPPWLTMGEAPTKRVKDDLLSDHIWWFRT